MLYSWIWISIEFHGLCLENIRFRNGRFPLQKFSEKYSSGNVLLFYLLTFIFKRTYKIYQIYVAKVPEKKYSSGNVLLFLQCIMYTYLRHLYLFLAVQRRLRLEVKTRGLIAFTKLCDPGRKSFGNCNRLFLARAPSSCPPVFVLLFSSNPIRLG